MLMDTSSQQTPGQVPHLQRVPYHWLQVTHTHTHTHTHTWIHTHEHTHMLMDTHTQQTPGQVPHLQRVLYHWLQVTHQQPNKNQTHTPPHTPATPDRRAPCHEPPLSLSNANTHTHTHTHTHMIPALVLNLVSTASGWTLL